MPSLKFAPNEVALLLLLLLLLLVLLVLLLLAACLRKLPLPAPVGPALCGRLKTRRITHDTATLVLQNFIALPGAQTKEKEKDGSKE